MYNKYWKFLCILLFSGFLVNISLSQTSEDHMKWWHEARFGMFIHWGVYAIPAHGEWIMYQENIPFHEYKILADQFNPKNYNPAEWVALAKEAGMKYMVITTRHHDGFCLWDSDHTRWNSMDMGPKRDLYGELVTALRKKENMKIISTFHHIRTFNWYLPYKVKFYEPIDEEVRRSYLSKDWDLFDPEYADLYWNQETGVEAEFIKEWNSKVKEVIQKYQPDVIRLDGGQFQDSTNEKMETDLLSHY